MSIRPTEGEYFVSWRLFFVCATVGGALGGVLVGGVTGPFLNALGIANSSAVFAIGGASFVVSALVSFVFFRLFVKRLVARTISQAAAATDAA